MPGVRRNVRGRRGVGFGPEWREVIIFLVDVSEVIFNILLFFCPCSPYIRLSRLPHITRYRRRSECITDSGPVMLYYRLISHVLKSRLAGVSIRFFGRRKETTRV